MTDDQSAMVQRDRISDQLRGYSGDYFDIAHQLASWMGLHSTDALAFIHILTAEDKGTPLSPAKLGEIISLTSGATTTLVNRLENRGCVMRTREHPDGRVVTLRSVPAMHEKADAFFAPLAERVDAVFERYPPDVLALFEHFLVDLRAALHDFLATEAEPAPQGDPATAARPGSPES